MASSGELLHFVERGVLGSILICTAVIVALNMAPRPQLLFLVGVTLWRIVDGVHIVAKSNRTGALFSTISITGVPTHDLHCPLTTT